MAIEKDKEVSGGKVNYYLVEVDRPNRPDQCAYRAECDDIASALGLTGYEFNVFKAIWRSANMRTHGLGKPGNKVDGIYDGEKIAHYGPLILKERQIKEEKRLFALKMEEAAKLLVRGDVGEGPNLARREEDCVVIRECSEKLDANNLVAGTVYPDGKDRPLPAPEGFIPRAR